MAAIELILILLAVSALLRALAMRLKVPHPVLLVLGGLAIALTPGLPRVALDPETLFVLFIPPLLYWGSITGSLRDFRSEWGALSRLAVGFVLVTIATVAVAAHALTPEFTWASAFVLGAIVSPPDPVAAIAIMRPLGVPPALARLLEGEGLLNDATALVAYRMAVTAAVAGVFVPGLALGRFVFAAAGGIAVGLTIAYGVISLRGMLARHAGHIPIVENAMSLLTPFAAYIAADHLGASGVLAVVAAGLFAGRSVSRTLPAGTRIQGEAMWSMVSFVLESLTFIFIGLELPVVRATLRAHSLPTLLWYAGAISLVVIATRVVLVYPSAYLPRMLRRATARADVKQHAHLHQRSFRELTFVGWAGLRGGDSLIIALALPYATATGAPFPARDLIVFVTFGVIFATLVLQGLSLAPVIRWLGLHEAKPEKDEEYLARLRAAQAGLARLDEIVKRENLPPELVASLRVRYQAIARHWELHADAAASDTDEARAHALSDSFRLTRRQMLDAEREAVIALRDSGEIGDDVLRRVQRDLDFETMLLDSADLDADGSPYDVAGPERARTEGR
ncbi:MAG: Na+/H+ antiporter [Gemmatimonadota bacterium]|nr:Na+/H+ antiporter [Gemmatimonadota bacterium]